jgi:hypothetical protein
MGNNRRLYLDFIKIQNLLSEMNKEELIDFLNNRVIIPMDDTTYEFLYYLTPKQKYTLKKVNRKLN